MEFTRRDVLRIGALSLASTTSSAWARSLGVHAPAGTGPAADSVLILVEGPWLYMQPVTGTVQCISLPEPHACQMGLWDAASSSLVSPYDPSQPGPLLPNSTAVTGKLASANPRPDVVKVFDEAFYRDDVGGADNYVYLRNTGLKAKAQATDRTVTIPVPDNVYVAGRVTNGAIVDASDPKVIVNPDTARLFVTYVFEYTQDATASTSLTIADGGGKTFTLTKGQHLIFQMQSAHASAEDVPHITHAFTEVVSRIDSGKLPLSIAFPAAVVSADIQLGVNAQGLSAAELGLHVTAGIKAAVPKKKSTVKYNQLPSCDGGGTPIFP